MHPFEKAVVFLMEHAAAGNMGLGVPRLQAREILEACKAPVDLEQTTLEERLEDLKTKGDKLPGAPEPDVSELSDAREFQQPPEGFEDPQ